MAMMFPDNDDTDMLASSEFSQAEQANNLRDADTVKTPSVSNLGGSIHTSKTEGTGLNDEVKKVEAAY